MTGVMPPLNVPQLNDRLAQVAGALGIPVARARVMLCTLVVSQMLPDAVAIKGGMGVKLRLGERGTRATSDLDVSTRARGEEFERCARPFGVSAPARAVADAPNGRARRSGAAARPAGGYRTGAWACAASGRKPFLASWICS
ncbi:hypothetical protein FB562_0590 [Homoserinimonas aerilata]|uniref:Nucleotidyltransferase AbiEii toxin of type IV toxin-antitoxin system n=1 Tax=Homoserinimonas aerilata TaxID=1162970 RepID=A0A542YHI0_9MICO|nr:hypothetical protein FB562_0590 [Homoserinimonas aerilata]